MEDRIGYPSVFVVDTPQRDAPFVPTMRKKKKGWQHGQLLLGILMLLILAGLAVQSYFLICFRKELDKAATQVTYRRAPDAAHEQLIQGPMSSTEKPAAHLTMGPLNESKNETLLWEHKTGLAFLQGIEYKNGVLVCLKSGHYYIYSKLYLRFSKCQTRDKKNPSVAHSIFKRTSRYPEELKLLTNVVPYCNWNNSLWNQNSFLAGVVYLEEKEEVFVKVSQPQLLIQMDDTRSYFGTFML